MKQCTIEGCKYKFHAKGMCQYHYLEQWYKKEKKVVMEENTPFKVDPGEYKKLIVDNTNDKVHI